MRMTELCFRSLREAPSDAEVPSHQLLLRGAFIRQVGAGIYAYLPLGQRVKARIEAVLREEMNAIGGQEVTMPVVQPAELWQRSGRWSAIGSDMARLQDAAGRDLCLAMTHEEAVTDLARQVVSSHKQLPLLLYQVQTKFRDEPRPRAGLIRVREFTMKDGYSFHATAADLDRFYPRVYEAYGRIFRRCGLDAVAVASDTGMMGGTTAHEFMVLSPVGEDTIVVCDACGARANRQVATFRKPSPDAKPPKAMREVHTPGAQTIEEVAASLGVATRRTAKAVFLVAELDDASPVLAHCSDVHLGAPSTADAEPAPRSVSPGTERERFVFAVVRGDMALNETKLANAIRARRLRPAEPEEIRAVGAEPGFASPMGIDRSRAVLIVDDLVAASTNLVSGANRPDYHIENVCCGRDYEADLVADIVVAEAGHACSACGASLGTVRGIEVGNTFKLGTTYCEAMGATYLNADGEQRAMHMGCYGIGIGRLMASVVEAHHDDRGIAWPVTIAPFAVSLVSLRHAGSPQVTTASEEVYRDLTAQGIETLHDDRDARPGVKFNDADLIGAPLRVTIGARGLAAGVVEIHDRASGERTDVPLETAVSAVAARLEAKRAAIQPSSHPAGPARPVPDSEEDTTP